MRLIYMAGWLLLITHAPLNSQSKGNYLFTQGGISRGATDNQHTIKRCGQEEYEQYIKSIDPLYEQEKQTFENIIKQVEKYGYPSIQVVYTIPVVVHIVYKTSTQNVTDAQVQAMIDRLNLDFRRLNSDTVKTPAVWKPIAADAEVQFCLATVDPNGQPTTGIVRKQTNVTSFTTDDRVKFSSQGGDDAWDPQRYFNIWICNLGGGVLGYAQFPWQGINNTYGVVVHYCTVKGTCPPYDSNRTVVHEVGHALGLYHIWGDDGGACTGSDQVSDTPNQANATFGCPSFPKTDACSPLSPGIMFMNYMDYSDDSCMNLFTQGQKTRMQAAINTYLTNLVSSNVCTSPFLPITLLHFSAEKLDHYIKLSWATASEYNNDYFIIEKSTDGLYWQIIAKVKGAGNSYSTTEYQVVDENPSPGLNYYRLSQVDYDGKITYLKTTSITHETPSTSIKVLLNQQTSEITLNIYTPARQNILLEITDITGRIVLINEIILKEGTNTFKFPFPQPERNMYILMINGENSKYMSKLVKI